MYISVIVILCSAFVS